MKTAQGSIKLIQIGLASMYAVGKLKKAPLPVFYADKRVPEWP